MDINVKLYYFIRPFIPRFLQIFIRRRKAKKILINAEQHWPIYPGSEKKPASWSNWPENKKFALVLVHDIETKKGYNNCKTLLGIERNLGFVSSFNFVPERYKINLELINQIKEQGFEVGVHGLKHDGKLFLSERTFRKRARKINYYLDAWDSVGFYAPSMHRDLEMIKDLNILYDQSTFDTDPFEPQPSGAKTIFPFFVSGTDKNRGFVELPYTLPQDHTLYIVLKEKDNTRWKRKLEWIVQQGGMALVKTHSDYMDFSGSRAHSYGRYPAEFYIDFLEFLKKQYYGSYWNVLPKQMAEYWKNEIIGIESSQ